VATLHQFLNARLDEPSFLRYDLRQRQMFTFPRMESPMFAMFLCRTSTRNALHRHQDFIKAQLIRPLVASVVAGNVTGVVNVDVVIEPFQSGIRHTGYSTVLVPVDGAGGSVIG
jgi:hypothetical protein